MEDDAAAARNFGWVSYVYIGAGGVIGLGLGDRSAGGEKMALAHVLRGLVQRPLVARIAVGTRGYGRSSDGIRWPLRQVVT